MPYEVIDGRIRTRSLESHIVDHCNLRCWGCCSLSPLLPKWWLEPERLHEDLERARRVLAPTYLKLVGGEPLLHPDIVRCLEIARASRIAPLVSVSTNGFLLPRAADAFWELVDNLTISLYPDPPLSEETIALVSRRAASHGVTLNWKKQDQFVDMTRSEPTADNALTQAIYDTCWLRERCHSIRDGRFFTCTRPQHFESLHGEREEFVRRDGVELRDDPDLVDDVLEYLTRREPLRSCAWCRGGDAELRPHHQLRRRELIVSDHRDSGR